MRIISKSNKTSERHYEIDEKYFLGVTLCGLDFIHYSVWEHKRVSCKKCIELAEQIEKEK